MTKFSQPKLVDDTDREVPTLDAAAADARANVCKVAKLDLMENSVTVQYTDHDTYGTEEFKFKGATIAQLVPFAEVALRSMNLPVPTIACPRCNGRNIRNCSMCHGRGRVLPSMVSSEDAAYSTTLDKYRDDDTTDDDVAFVAGLKRKLKERGLTRDD